MKPIPYGKQQITEQDIQAVVEALRSDYLTQGPIIQEFEEHFTKYIGCNYTVVVANGTAALHLSALALNIKPGDKVITTPITFAASANCGLYAGGEVVFADIDPKTYILDINKVEDILKKEKNIKGIIPVDFAGYPVDMENFKKLAEKYGVWLLEDAAHAPGGYFFDSNKKMQKCGNCSYADLSIFSFHAVKHIAAGEGGMITTNDKTFYEKLINLRTHGITKAPEFLGENHGGWYYEMQNLGFNYRITDLQAALAISQLNRAGENIERRRQIAKYYNIAFKDKSYIISHSGDINGHAYHLYIIEVEDRKCLYDYLRENGIYTQVHYIPIHLQPYYQKFGWKKGDFPISENYYKHCLSLPMFPSLNSEEQDFVISKIIKYYEK